MKFLLEMADTCSEMIRDLHNMRKPYLLHLIKVFCWKEPLCYKHWKHEIYEFFNEINKLKATKKYPPKEFIYEHIFGSIEDTFIERLPNRIFDLNYKYIELEQPETKGYNLTPLDAKNIDTERLHKFLKDYTWWLSENLSKFGEVSYYQVSDKLDSLLGV